MHGHAEKRKDYSTSVLSASGKLAYKETQKNSIKMPTNMRKMPEISIRRPFWPKITTVLENIARSLLFASLILQ